MMKPTQKKILLAIDGSDRAFETVRYVSRITPFQKMQVVLFTVFSKIPERYWDLEREPIYGQRLREIRAWETTNRMAIKRYMDEARQKLLDSGFSQGAVAVKIHERERGIARDIISESRRGYSAVVVGRKGMSKVKDLVLGSVATKLVEKIASAPILVVGWLAENVIPDQNDKKED